MPLRRTPEAENAQLLAAWGAALVRVRPMENSIKFGKVWGIEIGAHLSWLLIFGLVTWSLATNVFPQRFPD